MANRQRGEIPIKLNGQEYSLRPTFQAMCNIADRTGAHSLILLSRRMLDGDIRFLDLAIIIQEGIKASGKDLDLDIIGEAIVEEGLVEFSKPIMEFIRIAVEGVNKQKNELAEVPTAQS